MLCACRRPPVRPPSRGQLVETSATPECRAPWPQRLRATPPLRSELRRPQMEKPRSNLCTVFHLSCWCRCNSRAMRSVQSKRSATPEPCAVLSNTNLSARSHEVLTEAAPRAMTAHLWARNCDDADLCFPLRPHGTHLMLRSLSWHFVRTGAISFRDRDVPVSDYSTLNQTSTRWS